jgi:predicted O-linked N-acetylglucosamine transferase (SPINDLY family)
MRKRLEKAFDQFIDVENFSDSKIAEHARDLEIDIAVDLTGFTQDGRTNIFALRAAPIQVNFLGYPGTLGASYMDYIIGDPTVIPKGSQKFYAEKIAYLPNSYQPNDRQRPRLVDRFSRAEAGLPEKGFIFCCFNNNFKITPKQFDLWAGILHQVEDSYLWLLEDNPSALNNLKDEIQKRGVDTDRLVFAPRVSPEDHLARLSIADLFLDTAPYNAHTTTSDALWVGLPVLSVIGKSFASRVAASLIFAVGLPELVVETDEAYVKLAVDLARTPDKLESLRCRLLTSYKTAPLFNSVKFTINLENLYTQMYSKYQSGLPPSEIPAFGV